jgi:hypothetical protein
MMGIFKKQGGFWIDYYVSGDRKRERIRPDRRLAETVLPERKVEIAEGRFLQRRKPITTTFDELAHADLAYARENKRPWDRDMRGMKRLAAVFTGKRLPEITPVEVERYKTLRLTRMDRSGGHPKPATVNRELVCLRSMFNVARKGLVICRVEY